MTGHWFPVSEFAYSAFSTGRPGQIPEQATSPTARAASPDGPDTPPAAVAAQKCAKRKLAQEVRISEEQDKY